MVAGKMSISLQPPAVPDGGPQEAQRARGVRPVRGQHRGEDVPVPLPRDGGAGEVLPGHQEPLVQAAARRAVWRYARGSHAHNYQTKLT